jgi:hypothetical protein
MDQNNTINNNEIAEKAPKNKEGRVGATIGSIIVIIIILAAGIYFLSSVVDKDYEVEAPGINEGEESSEVSATSTEIEDIEKLLEDTELDDLDAELDSI